MKKFFLCLSAPLLFLLVLTGCNPNRRWNQQERKAMREALHEYRDMAYLNDLTDAEYTLFADDVTNNIEADYPVYATFIRMPGADDTVQVVVVETIVDELNADMHNMRHLYPYPYLVAEGVLPAGLDHSEQRQFYNCFAARVNANYVTMEQFFNAVLADTTDKSQIRRLENQCASELFNWTVVTEVEEVIAD